MDVDCAAPDVKKQVMLVFWSESDQLDVSCFKSQGSSEIAHLTRNLNSNSMFDNDNTP